MGGSAQVCPPTEPEDAGLTNTSENKSGNQSWWFERIIKDNSNGGKIRWTQKGLKNLVRKKRVINRGIEPTDDFKGI